MFEGLGGDLAAGAGGGGIVVPRGVGAEVALTRPHLVETTGGKLVYAHERVGLERGAERVSGRIWRGLVPFFHEEVLALKPWLGVGAARGGLRVAIDKQVLRGYWEGVKAVGAEEKQHGVGEGIKGEVRPVLRGGSRLGPRKGKAAARVPRA